MDISVISLDRRASPKFLYWKSKQKKVEHVSVSYYRWDLIYTGAGGGGGGGASLVLLGLV